MLKRIPQGATSNHVRKIIISVMIIREQFFTLMILFNYTNVTLNNVPLITIVHQRSESKFIKKK